MNPFEFLIIHDSEIFDLLWGIHWQRNQWKDWEIWKPLFDKFDLTLLGIIHGCKNYKIDKVTMFQGDY